MKIEFREPKATPVGFAQYIESIFVKYALNTVPLASINGHWNRDAKTSVLELDATELTRKLAQIQNFKFGGGSTNLNFTVNDGKYGSLTWQGLYNGPSYTTGVGNAQFGSNSIAAVSKLQELRTDIYASTKPLKSGAEEVPKGSIPQRLKKVLENLIKNFEEDLNKSTATGLDREILQFQHQKNQKVIDLWFSILQNSEDNPKLLKETHFALDQAISDHIARVYLSDTSNFFDTILQFCNDFRLVYVPALSPQSSAPNGKLLGTSNILDASPKSKTVNLETFSADVAGFNEPPITGVWVTGSGNAGIKLPSGLGSQIYGVWPEGSSLSYDGGVRRIAPPPWVPTPQPLNTKVDSTPKSLLSQPSSRVITINTTELADISKINFNIFTEWARLWYLDLKYANEVADIVVPLDLEWEVGKMYNLQNEKGSLMKGLAVDLQHNLSTKDGFTSVRFSHVRYT